MSMGSLNMKLMQGIEEAENQMQKEKQTQKAEEKENMENETKGIQKTAGKPQTAKKQPSTKKNTGMGKKNGNEPGNMQKQVFSFRAYIKDISMWRAYSVASGKTMEDVCNAALNEYLKKHKLTGAEQAIFDAIKARDSNDSE